MMKCVGHVTYRSRERVTWLWHKPWHCHMVIVQVLLFYQVQTKCAGFWTGKIRDGQLYLEDEKSTFSTIRDNSVLTNQITGKYGKIHFRQILETHFDFLFIPFNFYQWTCYANFSSYQGIVNEPRTNLTRWGLNAWSLTTWPPSVILEVNKIEPKKLDWLHILKSQLFGWKCKFLLKKTKLKFLGSGGPRWLSRDLFSILPFLLEVENGGKCRTFSRVGHVENAMPRSTALRYRPLPSFTTARPSRCSVYWTWTASDQTSRSLSCENKN